MKISIIGGSGFIGTRLSQRLTRTGQQFNIVDKAPSRAFPGHVHLADVRGLDALREHVSECLMLFG